MALKPLSSAEGRAALAQLARASALLGFDFDGTLAPIVAEPREAALAPELRAELARLAELYPCVVISGRARADVARRLAGVPLREVVGNHGLESRARAPSRRVPAWARRVRAWGRELAAALDGAAGVQVEDKGLSLSIHYRAAPRPAEARRLALRSAQRLAGARVLAGKSVLNVLPAAAGGKQHALLAALRRCGCRRALFVGDDRTDEDVFALGGNVLGVRVGRARNTKARYFLPKQDGVLDLIRALIRLRS